MFNVTGGCGKIDMPSEKKKCKNTRGKGWKGLTIPIDTRCYYVLEKLYMPNIGEISLDYTRYGYFPRERR